MTDDVKQPPPKTGKQDVTNGLGDLTRLRHERRRTHGLVEYGTPLMTFNGRNAFADLADELVDAQAYARQAEMEYEALKEELANTQTMLAATRLELERSRLVPTVTVYQPSDRIADALRITVEELIDARRRIAELEAENRKLKGADHGWLLISRGT